MKGCVCLLGWLLLVCYGMTHSKNFAGALKWRCLCENSARSQGQMQCCYLCMYRWMCDFVPVRFHVASSLDMGREKKAFYIIIMYRVIFFLII